MVESHNESAVKISAVLMIRLLPRSHRSAT
jgi:hypothetical protein